MLLSRPDASGLTWMQMHNAIGAAAWAAVMFGRGGVPSPACPATSR